MTPTPLFLFSVSKLAVDYHSVKQYVLSTSAPLCQALVDTHMNKTQNFLRGTHSLVGRQIYTK